LADTKLTGLTTISTASSVDLFYAAHDPYGTPVSRAISASSLFYSVPSTGMIIGVDTNLYRGGDNLLVTDDNFAVAKTFYLGGEGVTSQILFGASWSNYDTNLYRASASTLRTDDSFIVGLNQQINGNLYFYTAAAPIYFGDGAGGYDVNLYRNAPNELRTDDAFTSGLGFASVTGSIYLRAAGAALYFGNSDDTYDVSLFRSAANQLTIPDQLVVSSNFWNSTLVGSGNRYVYCDADGKLIAGASYP